MHIVQNRVAPVIVTERLRLRAHCPTDLTACGQMWADPRVTEFIGGQASSLQQTWSRLLGYAGHWSLMGFGYWVVEEREGCAFVGEVGFADYKRAIDPALAGIPESGWALAPAMHGKGYATEALEATVAWADSCFPTDRTICIIDPANRASIRVAEKCGYREWQRTKYNNASIIVFSRLVVSAPGNEFTHPIRF